MTHRTGRMGRRYARGGLFAATAQPSSSAPKPPSSTVPGGSNAPGPRITSPGPTTGPRITPGSTTGPKLTPGYTPGPGITPEYTPGPKLTPKYTPGPKLTPGDVPGPGPGTPVWPKVPGPNYHPPGPGIGLRPGPAPALGRPGLLPRDHGAWKNDSCYAQGSKGWKPDIMSIGDAHTCPGEKGPQSSPRPPNISGGGAGYNSQLFRNEKDVAQALLYLGYRSPDGNAMLRKFQQNWNLVISRIAYVPDRYRDIPFAHLPQGNLRVDGDIGPHSLNALEIAIVNQRMGISWPETLEMVMTAGTKSGYEREHLYNAAQGM